MPKKGTNIYRRKDGRWEGRYIKEYDHSGRAKYGYVYAKSYREAREKQLRMQAGEEKRDNRKCQKIFAWYCEEWAMLNRTRVKKSTCVKYFGIVKKHIQPNLGGLLPSQLSTMVIEEFSTRLLSGGSTGKGLSPKTVRDILTVLHSILKYTKNQPDSGLPPIDIIYPKETKKEMRILSLEEQYRLVQYLLTDTDECRFGILLALMTGIRIGELCALRWNNISLRDKTIKVTNTMQRLQTLDPALENKTAVVIGEPKSETSRRIIPLTEQAADLCQRMVTANPSAFVLTGQCYRFMEPRAIQYRLKKYLSECNISGVTFHTLRHTFATRCVEAEFEIKSLSEILGHSSVQITLDRYVHPSMELKRENMKKLAAVGF